MGSALPAAYIAMLARDGHRNPQAFAHAVENMFNGIDFAGKRVLEIGSGTGLLAIYMGMRGAQVVSMEPELVGATSGVIAEQQARLAALGMRNVEVVNADFNTWDAGNRRFDVIVSRSSINHLHASEHHAERHKETYDAYVQVARRVRDMLAAGGVFVVTDSSRYAFFSGLRRFGIRRPWRWERSGVDWRHHQNAGTWKRIFRDAGFTASTVTYQVPYRLRALRPVVDTAVTNFFLQDSFILRAHR